MIKRFQSVSLMLFLMGVGALSATAANAPVQMDELSIVQQTGTVTGQVKDASGEPLIGASVIVKGTTTGATTDTNGRFTIKGVKQGATLHVSYIGYVSQDVVFNGGELNLVLQEDRADLEEVVVVGYGTTKKRDLIASVSTVKTDEIANVPVTNLAQGLAGRSPGLIVQASGGGINSRPNVSIRGGGTPLYVIDGVVRTEDDFANLNPEDIQSMSILKDASATAVYGSRATNGIVQIVTKAGKEGKPAIEYDFNFSWAQPNIWPEKLGMYERAQYANIASKNDGGDVVYNDAALKAFQDGSDPEHFSDTNWRELVLNNWAPQQKHTVRITGGTEVNRYFASFGAVDQQSLYKSKNHWMKRYNFRLAQQSFIKPIGLHVNLTFDGYLQEQTHPYTSSSNSYYHVFSHINDRPGYMPGVNDLGLPYAISDNPVAETANDAGYNRNKWAVMNGKGELVWDCLWVDGLKLRVSGDYRYYGNTSKQWRKDSAKYNWGSDSPVYDNVPMLYHSSSTGYGFTTQAFAEYAKDFGEHSVSALAGFERYYEHSENYWERRENYAFEIDQIEIGDANKQTNGGSEAELGRAAFIAQAKYNYGGRYYVEGSMRRDGSDYFAPGHRWGNFFGASVGWVLTGEKFMQSLVERNIFNTLKLRASYGETGQDNSAGRFAYLTSYGMSPQGYVVNGAFTTTFTEGNPASPDLTWYTTRQTDLGFDFASLNNRLYGSFDYFYYSTKGYLVAPTGESYINTALGVTMPKVKSDSEFRRAGYEVQVGWRDNVGDFKYNVSANMTYYQSLWAVIADEAESSRLNPFTRQAQQKANYYSLLYHSLGYYSNAADVMNSPAYVNAVNSGYLTAGDIKYEDTNGDGKIDGNDQRRLGNSSAPHIQYGINIGLGYKGWYFSTLLQGSGNFDMYIAASLGMQTGQTFGLPVAYEYQKDFWTVDNINAQYPRLMANTALNSNNNYLSSDFWTVNGRYLRMKDLQFGYDFKYCLLKNVNWLTRAKVGISGQNLFTISKAKKYGLDPENSSTSNYGYPVERTIALTVNLGF